MRTPVKPEDCTTPEYHVTHRYCPTCTWSENDNVGSSLKVRCNHAFEGKWRCEGCLIPDWLHRRHRYEPPDAGLRLGWNTGDPGDVVLDPEPTVVAQALRVVSDDLSSRFAERLTIEQTSLAALVVHALADAGLLGSDDA